MNLKSMIREIPDWPKPGVNFKDITSLIEKPQSFSEVIKLLSEPYQDKKIDKIVGIDARGFLFAAPVAFELKTGLIVVRKKGKLPPETIQKAYILEYGEAIIEIEKDAIKAGERIVLIDDLCATGGTALAACELIEDLGGIIAGVSFVVDLPFLNGSKKLIDKNYIVRSLVQYDSE